MRPIRSSFALALTAVVMCFAACQKTPEPELSVSKNEFSLDARGGYISVSVTTNVKVSVNIQGSWITQDGSSDGGSGTYGFKVDFNEGYDSRTGSITFSNSESGVSQIVSVTQAQQDVIIPGSNEYSLFYEAQTFSLPVSSNVDFTVSVDGGDWIKSLGTRGISKKELQFSIAENAGKEPREATITVTAGALKQIIKVEQLATTHRPETEEELITTIKLADKITEESENIILNVLESSGDETVDASIVADKLLELDGVYSAEPSPDGESVIVMQKDSLYVNILLNTTDQIGGSEYQNSSPRTSIATRASLDGMVIPNGKTALILAPFQSSFNKPLDDYKMSLTDAGYTVKVFENDKADISKFEGEYLQQFDVIIMDTHGGHHLRNSTSVDFTSLTSGTRFNGNIDLEELFYRYNNEDYSVFGSKELYNEYFVVGINGKNYLAASNLNLKSAHFDDKLVFLSACLTGTDISGNGSFMKAFSDRGAGAVLGYNISIPTTQNDLITSYLFTLLSFGCSLGEAIDFCKGFLGEKTMSPLVTLPQNADSFHLFDPRPSKLKPVIVNDNVTLTWATPKTGIGTYFGSVSFVYDIYLDDNYVGSSSKPLYTLKNLSAKSHDIYVVTRLVINSDTINSFQSETVSVSIKLKDFLNIKTESPLSVNTQGASIPITTETNWNPDISSKGVVYSSTVHEPTYNGDNCQIKSSSGSNASFSVQLNTLKPNTVYYARGYIVLSTGEVLYGNVISFTTLEEKKPAITVDMSSLVFADTKVGEKSTASFVITNTGSANLTVSLSGAGGVYSMDWTSGTINPNGGSQKVTVTFSPNKAADFTSSIKISSNAGSDKTISLSGKGISAVEKTAKIEVSKTELKFEDKKQGESATLSFTIRNTGTADLKVAVSDPGAPFSVSWNEKTIAPNGCETLSVVFAPNKVADFNAKLQISSNATNGTKYLTLTGKGILDPNTGGDEQKPVISFSSTSLTFTSVMVGETGTQTITVSNMGTKALKINKITCPSGFSSSWSSKTIAAKGSEPLTITFAPTSAKTYSGDLVIESDASNGTSKIILLSGTGTAKPEPKLSVSTTDLNFGNQVCFSQESKTITITNSGTGTLNISSITKTNNYGSLFTLSGWTSGGTITAGASKTITVSFQPIEQRTYEETLTIVSSNATNNKTQTIRLRGTGSPEPENPVLNFSTSSLSFGDVEVGESSTKSFTITNTGTTVLNISSIKIVANDNTQNPSYYSITPSDACTIAANKSKSFSVTFSPEAVKSYGATISITSNATNATQGTSILNISGTGIKATSKILTASPSSLSFGMQAVGNRTHKNFTVTNSGTKAVTLYSMEATDGFIVDQTWAEGNTLGLAAGASKTFSAYFAPTQTKAYNGQLVIKSNASNGDLVIPLSGTGAEAQGYIEIISGQTMDFGNVNVGTSGSLSAKIKNSGEASMRILSIDCPDGFSATCNVSSVSAGYNTTVNVFFTPTLAKSYSGTVVIHTDAENETAEIDVSGVGKPTISTETFVDMGVSVKWASKNVGASRPEDYGHYVAWGEVSTKTQYLYNNYKWYVGDAVFSGGGYITKYCTSPEPYGYQGFSNPLKMLAYEDDYAQAKLKGLARTPTRKEWEELKKNSDWVWTQENGINGYLVTSKITGNSIFLPAGGSIEYSNKEVNEVGYYWTSDLNHEESYATTWEIRSNKPWYSYRQRYIGLNVRAVEDDTAKPMIYFSTGKLSFVGTKIGTTASKNLTIKNIGKGTLTISKVSTSSRFSPSWTSATIEPGESKTLTVSYTPVYDPNLVIEDELTWDSTTLNFTTNARNENSYTIYLEGYGVE